MDNHTAKGLVRQRRIMAKVQKLCDERSLPYPPDLVDYLMKVRRFRSGD